jgi:glycosyltransferase involved in cell wall biosynthesis
MVCETKDIQRSAAALFGNHVYQIPYAVRDEVALQDRVQARQNLGLPTEGLVLLMFGTHREGKDYDTVVLAAQRARAQVHLLFAGMTVSGNNPAQVVARHGYDRALIVEKFISAPEAPLYFAACDAVVLPYTGNYQKGSYVLFEALQFRRPSLAADTGFLREFIEENRCGLVFQPGDAADLARVLDALAGLSEDQRRELSVRIEDAAQRFSWKTVIKDYVRLYRRLSGGGAAG